MLAADIQPPALKLTAVVLAHMKNAKTGLLNPSMATVAARVGISPSQAQRCMRQLKDRGLLSVAANAYGGKPGTTPSYRLHLDHLPRGSADATPTGGTDAAPTGSADAAPGSNQTGSTGAAEGQHGCGTGVAPMRPTGSTHAAQTGINRKGTGREPEGLQLDAFEDGSPADAGSHPRPVALLPSKKVNKAKPEAPTAAVWDAYSAGFLARYGVDPVRNAKVNGQLANLVARLGVTEAPQVAAFFVRHERAFYAQKMHSVDALLKDAEQLRVEMLTGRTAPQAGGVKPAAPRSFEHVDYNAGVANGRIA